jgi:N-acylneuraminate cytidylyltransferase
VNGSVVAIIPARGGSKGLPRKNIRLVAGRPLLAWTIEDARESTRVDRVFVSTEDAEIARVARENGSEVIDRPADLARDETSSEAVLIHALEAIEAGGGGEPDLMVFLQATSPVRTGADIDAAVAQFESAGADSLLSVSPSHAFLWREVGGLGVPVNHDYRKRMRRQDLPPQYRENGSLYVFKPWVLKQGNNRLGGRIVLYRMSEEAGIDIDSESDLEIAAAALRRRAGDGA